MNDVFGPFKESIHRLFIIGGASIYTEAIQMQNVQAKPLVDRILLTRLHSPTFEDCNVYFPEALGEDRSSEWALSTHGDLEKWLGFEVPEGVQEEKGIEYEFQMWTRQTNPVAVDVERQLR
jgi:dihydrofolate reductase